MANKRMFSNQIIQQDSFLDMPLSSQALYFHLNMEADNLGFIGSPKRIARKIGANEDDLIILAYPLIILWEGVNKAKKSYFFC